MIELANSNTALFALLVTLWTLPWKGWALWIAAKNGHKKWFIALLIINTLAILEIIYIFAVGRKALKTSEEPSSEETA